MQKVRQKMKFRPERLRIYWRFAKCHFEIGNNQETHIRDKFGLTMPEGNQPQGPDAVLKSDPYPTDLTPKLQEGLISFTEGNHQFFQKKIATQKANES